MFAATVSTFLCCFLGFVGWENRTKIPLFSQFEIFSCEILIMAEQNAALTVEDLRRLLQIAEEAAKDTGACKGGASEERKSRGARKGGENEERGLQRRNKRGEKPQRSAQRRLRSKQKRSERRIPLPLMAASLLRSSQCVHSHRRLEQVGAKKPSRRVREARKQTSKVWRSSCRR